MSAKSAGATVIVILIVLFGTYSATLTYLVPTKTSTIIVPTSFTYPTTTMTATSTETQTQTRVSVSTFLMPTTFTTVSTSTEKSYICCTSYTITTTATGTSTVTAVSTATSYIILPVTTTTTTTVTASSTATVGNALYRIPVVLTNAQSVPTPAPMQQLLTVNWASYAPYLASNLANVGFYDAAGNPVPAWCESSCSSASFGSSVWVRLGSSVPAGGSATVFVYIFPAYYNNFSNQWGEYPSATGSYAQYDNGAQVFALYTNFGGSSLSNAWVVGGAAATVSNGLTLSCSGPVASWSRDYLILNTNEYGLGYAFDSYAKLSSGGTGAAGVGIANGNSATTYAIADSIVGALNLSPALVGSYYSFYQNPVGTMNQATTPFPWSYDTYSVLSESQSASGLLTNSINYGSSSTGVATYNPPSQYPTLGIYCSGGALNLVAQWFRVRAYPPNGVMPSASFGPIASA